MAVPPNLATTHANRTSGFTEFVMAETINDLAKTANYNSPINPKAYGAISDGVSHTLSAGDVATNTATWIGTYVAGDEWDYVGYQEAIYAAFARNSTPGHPVWNGNTNQHLNRTLLLPAGILRLNKQLVTNYLVGGLIKGEGRLATHLRRVGLTGATTATWQFNGCAHTKFENLSFDSTGNHGTNGSFLDLDWDGSAGGGGLHGNTFDNVLFDALSGGASVDYHVRVAFTGALMGDTHYFKHCHFTYSNLAAFTCNGSNALCQKFADCDFYVNKADDIYVVGGSVHVENCSVEGNAWGTTAKTGHLLHITSGAGNHVATVKNCRLEVPRVLNSVGNGPGHVALENVAVGCGPTVNWAALTAMPLNGAVKVLSATGAMIYAATTAGTTGASQPTWPTGGGTVVDGSVTWTHQDIPDMVSMTTAGEIENCFLPWGRVVVSGLTKPITIKNNTFSRTDWLTDTNTPFDLAGSTLEVEHNVVSSTGLAGGTPLAYSSPGHGANVDTIADPIPSLRQAPIVWALGAGGSAAYGDVGLGRNDGVTNPNNVGAYNEIRYSRNVLALLGDGSFGKLAQTVADTVGSDLRLQAGLGTGTAVSGGVSLRAGSAIAGSGTTPNNAGEVLRVDPTGIHFKGAAIANGQSLDFPPPLTELLTIAAAATTTSTIQIPAGAVVFAVSVRVTTVIPTAASMQIGDGTTANKFNTGANIAVAAGTTDGGTKAGPTYYAAATSIVITPNLTPANNSGRVRVTIHYFSCTPPTS